MLFRGSRNNKKVSLANNPRANGAKRRSGRKPGARVTNFALGKFKVIAHGSLVALGGPH